MLMEVAFMRSVRDVNTDTCLKNEKKIVSNDECRKSCHHELHNLIPDGNIWWCTKSKINGQEWKMRPQGCALCGGKFCRED